MTHWFQAAFMVFDCLCEIETLFENVSAKSSGAHKWVSLTRKSVVKSLMRLSLKVPSSKEIASWHLCRKTQPYPPLPNGVLKIHRGEGSHFFIPPLAIALSSWYGIAPCKSVDFERIHELPFFLKLEPTTKNSILFWQGQFC